MSAVAIRGMEAEDWPAVERIWAEGIATGNATFEAEPPSWEYFDATRRPDLRLVATGDDGVLGWVAASPVSSRPVYAGVVENSLYVSGTARGQGIGRALLEAFISRCHANGVWTIQSTVFPENTASLALHEALGFTRVGTRRRIGLMPHGPHAGLWRDTILLEHRHDRPDAPPPR
ncbi:GNAT family N-acetyltransferase [Sinomonas terrae]|uniref:GNAT family N-acetyltransferase n=1 Tax=Sinomonas terrae TaxID=2908838 RepID=A0ABS9U041_9MICC|nr:GNAT family N-acetyltransferase [Sinomonas terrae]MCH6469877.1 GNAT family N-acetyltransferase [Sinomonas terrae]